MTRLPDGTLTFFFSDIEGSTRLLEALGDRYPGALERHRAIVRDAFARRGAVEVSTQGDSFFAVFPEAPAAVVAAVAIQRGLAAEAWPDGATLRIRIGLHTGDAHVSAGDYVGLDVHRAARIMAAGHGGQIVASEATCALARPGLDDGIGLRDLGEHRLKDLSAPERLFQVTADGLAADFPPLRTLDRTPNNLPTQPSVLVGRAAELATIRGHLERHAVRLVTLTGPGGIGKTRLALQAAADEAERVEHGVYFVDLSGAQDADGVLREIARAVGVAIQGGSELRAALAEHLAPRELLLVLDNFEQVMAAADQVAGLLKLCPRLRLIVTSREALRIRGEQLLPVAPLSLPDRASGTLTAAEAATSEAVRLFVERATEARPEFRLTDANAPVVAEICARLDGLPLAIELAAARLRLFSPEELRDRLRSRLDVLRGGARDLPARQRTLRSTIEWSHDLLDDEERAVFGLLSVFPSARIEAVEAVAAQLDWLADADVVGRLESLVDKSLVRSVADGRGQRLSMLETIREYAAERLDGDGDSARAVRAEAAREAHAEYYARFADARVSLLRSEGRRAALDELAAELGNLMVAWRQFVDRGDLARLHLLLDALWPLHEARGWYHGALALINDLLGVMADAPPAPERAEEEITLRLSVARGLLAIRGYTEEVERLYREAIALADSAGAIPRRLPVMRSLASFYLYRGEMDKTAAIGREVLLVAAAESDARLQLEGHLILGPALAFTGQWREGLDHLDQAIELFDPERYRSQQFRLGPNPGVAAASVSALLHWVFGYPETSERRAATALDFAAQLAHPYSLAYGTFHVALLDLWRGRIDVSHRRAAEVVAIAQAHEYDVWTAVGVVLGGVTTAALGSPDEGVARVHRGVALYREIPTPPVFWPQILTLRATAQSLAGQTVEALATVDEGLAIAAERSWDSAVLKILRADLMVAIGDGAGAERLLAAAFEEAGQVGARMIQLRAATRLTRLSPRARERGRALLGPLLATYTEGLDTPEVLAARAALDGRTTDVH